MHSDQPTIGDMLPMAGGQRRLLCLLRRFSPLSAEPPTSLRLPPFPLLILLLAIVGGPGTAAALKIVGGLAPVSVAEGGSVVLHCNFSKRPDYVFWKYRSAWSKEEAFIDVSFCSMNNRKCNLKPKFVNYAELLSANNGSLVIRGVRRRNDGIYRCEGVRDSDLPSSQARLTVLVPPGRPLLTFNRSRPLVGDFVAFTCNSSGGNPVPHLVWKWHLSNGSARADLAPKVEQPTAAFGTIRSRLTLRMTPADHLSVVRCEASNSAGNATSRYFSLEVSRLPGGTTIVSRVASPREGDAVTFICTSVGGNPAPVLRWGWTRSGGGVRKLPSPTVAPPDRPFGTARSELLVRVDHRDDDSRVSCGATNRVGDSTQMPFVLRVTYKPRLEAFHYSPLAVMEGNRVMEDCRVRANPPPRVTWRKEGGTVPSSEISGSALSISRLDRRHAGLYTCTASNSMGASQLQLELRVLYAPTVLVPASVVVPEGQTLVLSCRVFAHPPADVQWYGPDGLKVGVAGPEMRLDGVTRRQAGRYECRAKNRLIPSKGSPVAGKAQNSTDVVVEYLPSAPVVVPRPSSSVLAGTEVILRCSVNSKDPGHPLPSLEWRRVPNGPVLATNGSFRLPRARLGDSGRYRCTPRNRVGAGPVRELSLEVEQKPVFNRSLGSVTKVLKLTRNDVDFSAYCTATGKPMPLISWSHNSVPITGSGNLYSVTSREVAVNGDPVLGYSVKSILAWRGTKRGGQRKTALLPEDNGSYVCEVTNTRATISSSMTLIVNYAPQFYKPARKVAVDLRQGNVHLRCPVTAQPPPDSIQWMLSDGRVIDRVGGTGSRLSVIQESPQPTLRLYTKVLTIRSLIYSDLGFYRCHTRNSEGNSTLTVELRNQSAPEVPTVLRVLSATWESALLTWVPGFHGGFPQTFDVLLEWGSNSGKRTGVTGDRYNLTQLLPNTSYALRLRGSNKLGVGPRTERIYLNTEALFIPRIRDVRLELGRKRITFTAPAGYCVKVEVSRDRGATWLPFRECLRPEDGAERVMNTVEEYHAAVCLQRRNEVCSPFVRAKIVDVGPQVPLLVILVVAVACAVLIIILFAVLLFFCFRKRPRRKNFDDNPSHRRPQAVTINPYAPTPPSTGPAVQRHSPPAVGKPYAMVMPTSGAAVRPGYENGAASFGGDEPDCARHRAGSPWDAEKRRSSPKSPMGSTFRVVATTASGERPGSALSPPSNSSQDPLLSSSVAPSDPPPYTDSVRRGSGQPTPTASSFELQPLGGRGDPNGGLRSGWGPGPSSPRTVAGMTLPRSAVGSPIPSNNPSLPLAISSSATCPRQPKKVIYEVVV